MGLGLPGAFPYFTAWFGLILDEPILCVLVCLCSYVD